MSHVHSKKQKQEWSRTMSVFGVFPPGEKACRHRMHQQSPASPSREDGAAAVVVNARTRAPASTQSFHDEPLCNPSCFFCPVLLRYLFSFVPALLWFSWGETGSSRRVGEAIVQGEILVCRRKAAVPAALWSDVCFVGALHPERRLG